MSIKNLSLGVLAVAVLAAPAYANNLPTDFASLDKDSSGTLTFAEYQAHSQAMGLSTTQAAQDFTRAAQGDALLTEEELNLALAFADQPYALQSFGNTPTATIEPIPMPVMESVEDAPVMAAEPIIIETPPVEAEPVETIEMPAEPEMMEPKPVEEGIIETPLEDVMGEVETYDPENEIQTPAEEGVEDILEDNETPDDPS